MNSPSVSNKEGLLKRFLDEAVIDQQQYIRFLNLSDEAVYTALQHHVDEDQLIDHACSLLKINSQFLNQPLIPDPELVADFSISYCQEKQILPIYKNETVFALAVTNPFSTEIVKIKEKYAPLKINLYLTKHSTLNRSLLSKKTDLDAKISILDQVLDNAIERNASDIHVYTEREQVKIMVRVNGKLSHLQTLTGQLQHQLSALIKFHSHMDISIVNLPQDGRISHDYNAARYDVRVSSLPSAFGEDFVMRLFNANTNKYTFSALGFAENVTTLMVDALTEESGLILVTGPTGSGKTTTLYTLLTELKKRPEINIVSLEDPIENIIPNIRQSQINPQAGYTFVKGLRAILRQDPDVIMIGEIRDRETAKIALEAAYTGHLVIATLHTANCESTLLRLSSFDLDPFLIGMSLKAVLSQRLRSTVCTACNQLGCEACNFSGTLGRKPITECLRIKNARPLNTQDDFTQLIKDNDFIPFA